MLQCFLNKKIKFLNLEGVLRLMKHEKYTEEQVNWPLVGMVASILFLAFITICIVSLVILP